MEDSFLCDWQNALFDLDNHFEVSLVGLSARLKMRPDWSIEGVKLPHHLFYYVVEGAFEVQRDSVKRRLDGGDLVWVAPGVPVFFRHLQADLVVLRFRLDARRANGTPIGAPAPLQWFSLAPGGVFLLERLVEAAQMPAAPHHERQMRSYWLALCCEMGRAMQTATASRVLTHAQCQAVRDCLARDFLATMGENWPGPTELARVCQLSLPYFTRQFTRTFGRSPRRFLLEERMRLAGVRLIESSDSVSQIARSLGYGDVFAFSRQFKVIHGQSPTLYRASHSLGSL